MFKRQIAELDKAVSNTAGRFDKIQEALDKVMEDLRLGNPVEPFHSQDSKENDENTNTSSQNETNTDEVKVQNSYDVFDRNQLLGFLRDQNIDKKKNPPRLSVGMIGYPNVGKSSTVNILMQTKKVWNFLL